jgi:hypothetical protein
MLRSEKTTAWMLGLVVVGMTGCVAEGRSRDSIPGLGFEEPQRLPVEPLEAGDFDPVAQYLVNNADSPIPAVDPESDGDPACDGFACADGLCIDPAWACDGVTDCAGGEDEAGCPGDDDGDDACDGFACNDGTCIPPAWKCDGITDCAGGEDEAQCGGEPQCAGFACDDGKCIDASWVCDGIIDCFGGEDEEACGRSGASSPTLGTAPRTSDGALNCIASWTGAGAGAGAAAGKVISSACAKGGVVVGLSSGGAGFAAATVCFGANVSQVDWIVGGVFGAISGLVGGVAYCEGNALAEAGAALEHLLTTGTIPTFQAESSENVDLDAKKCGIPENVPRTGDEAQCKILHDEMKEFGKTHPTVCDLDIGNIPNDPAAIAAACSDIRTRFANAAELAERRLEIGESCYQNGSQGPMGNSDYVHQVAWCQVHNSLQNCVEQARHPKLDCSLTQTMAQHASPIGCDDLLACKQSQGAGV